MSWTWLTTIISTFRLTIIISAITFICVLLTIRLPGGLWCWSPDLSFCWRCLSVCSGWFIVVSWISSMMIFHLLVAVVDLVCRQNVRYYLIYLIFPLSKLKKISLAFVSIYPHGLVWTHREGTALKRNAYNEIYSGNS